MGADHVEVEGGIQSSVSAVVGKGYNSTRE